MSSPTLTCRCRFCAYTLSYLREDSGGDVRCPQCGQDIRLPGKLSTVATVVSGRQHRPAGLALEIGGFACMFFLFPWGLVVGSILLFFGWRKARTHRCSNCGALVKPDAEKCPRCKSAFASES